MEKFPEKLKFYQVPEIPGRLEGEYEPDPNEIDEILFKEWHKNENGYDTWY